MNLYLNVDGTPVSFKNVKRFVVDVEDRELLVHYGDGRETRTTNADFDAIMADWPKKAQTNECPRCGGLYGAATLGCTCGKDRR